MVKRIKNLVSKVFCILGALTPLLSLTVLLLMLYNNTWTITSVMQFVFFTVLYLASTIDNAVDRVIDKIAKKKTEHKNKNCNQ